MKLIQDLENVQIKFRISYILIYQKWFQDLKKIIEEEKKVEIKLHWHFKAHHFLHNLETWKLYHSLGGGCLRFYAIHIISILSKLGFQYIHFSKLFYKEEDVPVRWDAYLYDKNNNGFKVNINIYDNNKLFAISIDDAVNEYNLYNADIFSHVENNKYIDNRSNSLETLLLSLKNNDGEYAIWYKNINKLWYDIEAVTLKEML